MKKVLLLLIAVTAFSCSTDDPQQLSNTVDLTGEWKQIALKISAESDEWDVTGCTGERPDGMYYQIFNDNTYKNWNSCEGATGEETIKAFTLQSNIINFNDSVISYTYNITDLGEGKIKLTMLTRTYNGETTDESNSGYYEIYQKQ